MRIEQKFQPRSASHSSGSLAGEIMSPRILAVPWPEPIQALRSTCTSAGGTTSATGLPKRVTRIGSLVLETCCSNERHLALNSEIAISRMTNLVIHYFNHSHNDGQPRKTRLSSRGRICVPSPRKDSPLCTNSRSLAALGMTTSWDWEASAHGPELRAQSCG